MTLRRIHGFHPRDPDKLARELTQLEDHLSRETADLRSGLVPRPSVDRTLAKPVQVAIAAQFDRQLSIDTTQGNRTVILPPLAPANFGKTLSIIWRSSGTNSIALSCQKPGDKINASASPATVASVVTIVYCDDAGYWLR